MYELLSHKIILVQPLNPNSEINMMVQHSEAGFEIKKLLIEKARNHWKELKDVSLNAILGHTA